MTVESIESVAALIIVLIYSSNDTSAESLLIELDVDWAPDGAMIVMINLEISSERVDATC